MHPRHQGIRRVDKAISIPVVEHDPALLPPARWGAPLPGRRLAYHQSTVAQDRLATSQHHVHLQRIRNRSELGTMKHGCVHRRCDGHQYRNNGYDAQGFNQRDSATRVNLIAHDYSPMSNDIGKLASRLQFLIPKTWDTPRAQSQRTGPIGPREATARISRCGPGSLVPASRRITKRLPLLPEIVQREVPAKRVCPTLWSRCQHK